jgi:hypothetical protein
MLSFFTIPKPFTDPHISIIQKNAILSWKKLAPDVQIILIGDDEGVKDIARELQVEHQPQVVCNEFKTPLLDSAFALAKQYSKFDTLCYLNCDIVLMDDFLLTAEILPKDSFLAVGQRWDLDVSSLINFEDDWQSILRNQLMKSGKLHSSAGIDYFIFNKNSFENIPSFAVGRVGWDNWMIYNAKKEGLKVIDASRQITAIHQNHDYPDKNKGKERKTNPEAKNNFSYLPSPAHHFTIDDANYYISGGKIKKRHLHLLPFWKRWVRLRMGGR